VIKLRLKHLPQLPHKPIRKKVIGRKHPGSMVELVERELERLALEDHVAGGLVSGRCSSSRGMISTKLQGR
jgi:hypothetical protein